MSASASWNRAPSPPNWPDDIADAVAYIVTRDHHVAVNEMLVRASDQTW